MARQGAQFGNTDGRPIETMQTAPAHERFSVCLVGIYFVVARIAIHLLRFRGTIGECTLRTSVHS